MQFNPQALFEHLEFSATGYVESYNPGDGEKVYAVIFHIATQQAEIARPVLELKFALESDVQRAMADGVDEGEARWSPQSFVQPPVAIFCQSEDSNGVSADPKGAAALEELMGEIRSFVDDADPAGGIDSEEIGEFCRLVFTESCVEVANNLHIDGVIRDAFGRDLPVIVYHENYDDETSSQMEVANPNCEAKEFLAWYYAQTGVPAPPEIPAGLGENDVSLLSCHQERYASLEVFRNWATDQWEKFEEAGPLAVLPKRAAYDVHDWSDLDLECYVALYPREAFSDLAEFDLFVQYTANIQRTLIETLESDPDLEESAREIEEIFLPPEIDEVIEGHSIAVRYKIVVKGDNINKLLDTWSLPESMHWMKTLNYIEGDAWATRHEGSLTAACEEGYLCFFAIDSHVEDEFEGDEDILDF